MCVLTGLGNRRAGKGRAFQGWMGEIEGRDRRCFVLHGLDWFRYFGLKKSKGERAMLCMYIYICAGSGRR